MQHYRYIILGGGGVAGYAAREFVELGLQPAELCIISNDNTLPYARPPLSKSFLAGEQNPENVLINDAAFYNDHGIAVQLDTEITIVDFNKKLLRARNRDEFSFDKLLIATGARVRTLDLPGASRSGIVYLRSLSDARGIRIEAGAARRAVVLGGSYIGMEVTAVLSQQNILVTMVYPDERLMERFFTTELSRFFEKLYNGHDVVLRKHTEPTAFSWDGRARAVKLSDGEQLPADLIVAGTGVRPNVELFADTGLQINDGIVVNEFLETNIANVYAAGDVANYRDVLYDKQRRVEHWDNAVMQGRHAARVMTNRREPYVHVPYFFSSVFGYEWEFWGDATGANDIVRRGELKSGSHSIWWLRDGRLVATFVMNRPDEEREYIDDWICSSDPVPRDLLADDSLSLRLPPPDPTRRRQP